MWKQLTSSIASSSTSFLPFYFFFDGWGGGDVHWRPVWCGVDGSPHRLSSSVLAGRDNYTAVWNKVCTEADGSYATKCIKPSGRHASSQRDKEQWQTFILQGDSAKITTTISCMFLSGWMHEQWIKEGSWAHQRWDELIWLTRIPESDGIALTVYNVCYAHMGIYYIWRPVF